MLYTNKCQCSEERFRSFGAAIISGHNGLRQKNRPFWDPFPLPLHFLPTIMSCLERVRSFWRLAFVELCLIQSSFGRRPIFCLVTSFAVASRIKINFRA